MEKVKITVEQEKVLKKYKNEVLEENWLSGYVKYRHRWLDTRIACLGELSFNDFSLILHGWYEVEQPVKFEVGDWGLWTHKTSSEYLKIAKIEFGEVHFTDKSVVLLKDMNKFEKVTEQWKITLLNLGREKPEFNKNDIIVTESEVYEAEYLSDEEIIVLFEKDLVRAFHAAEHRIEVKGNES